MNYMYGIQKNKDIMLQASLTVYAGVVGMDNWTVVVVHRAGWAPLSANFPHPMTDCTCSLQFNTKECAMFRNFPVARFFCVFFNCAFFAIGAFGILRGFRNRAD